MTDTTQADAPVTDTTSTTTTDAPAEGELSLRDEISGQIELAEKGTEKPEDLSAAARRLASARKGKPADTTTAKVEEKPTEGKTDEPKPETKETKPDEKKVEETAVEAPAHWPAADREMFAKQPPEVRTWLLNRHKAMEADYTRKTQELAPIRREAEELDEIFKPWAQEMALGGITRVTAVRQLAAAHKRLQEDPVGGLKWLAEQYAPGKDLKTLIEGAAAADPAGESPTVRALRAELAELKQWKTQFTGQQGEQQMNAHLNEVTQFADAKDAQGQPLRPHFDEVAQDIALMIRAAKLQGQTLTLQDAYDRAVHANPTTRAKVLAAQDAQRRAKEEAERKAKADAAKKAGFDVKGEGAAAQVVANPNSLRGDLEAAFAAAEGRV